MERSVGLTTDQIAAAFSSHRFSEAYPSLSTNVRWNSVGGEVLEGRDAVIAKCDDLAQYLATVVTRFSHLETTAGADHVVVESVATYTESNGEVSTVASCDIYRFAGDQIMAIASYNIEIAPS